LRSLLRFEQTITLVTFALVTDFGLFGGSFGVGEPRGLDGPPTCDARGLGRGGAPACLNLNSKTEMIQKKKPNLVFQQSSLLHLVSLFFFFFFFFFRYKTTRKKRRN
jgi:hypothetical protein